VKYQKRRQCTDVEVWMVSKCVYNSSRNPPQMKATNEPTTPDA